MRLTTSFLGKKRLRHLIFLFDSLWICLATGIALFVQSGSLDSSSLSTLILPIVVCLALWTLTTRKLSLDQLQEFSQLSAIFSRVTIGVVLLVPLMMGLAFLARNMYSRLFFVYLGPLLVFGFTALRIALKRVILQFRSHFALRTVIIGSGRVAMEIAGNITSCPELMRDLVAFVHPANCEPPDFSLAAPASGLTSLSSLKLLDVLLAQHVGEVILADFDSGSTQGNQLIWQCHQNGIEVCVIPHSYNLYSSHARILNLGGLPFVKVESHIPQSLDLLLKRSMDLLLLGPLLILSFPPSIVIAASLILRKRSVLHSERRCGYKGRTFRMYRFNLPRHSEHLGAFDSVLDRLSLTELPQLWNVVKGDMSLVGPRPEDPARVQNYSEWQRQRLAIQPGMTGLAQVEGLRDNHSSDEKSRYDLQYIHKWSPLVDLALLVQTAWTLCFRIKQSQSNRRHSAARKQKPQNPVIPGMSLGDVDVNRAQSGAD